MNPLSFLYTEIIYRPLLNSLVAIYALLPPHDLGLTIIVLTLLVRLLLHPTLAKTIRSQQALAKLQPHVREIQERFKGNREEQGRRTMELYRTHGVNPLSGCLPMLAQIPILIGLYQVFFSGITLSDPALLYSFVPRIQNFNPIAFGLFDLAKPSIVLAITAGLTQFLQSRYLPSTAGAPDGQGADFAKAMRWQMSYFFPLMIAGISYTLPAALAFYWTILNLVAIVEHLWIQRRFPR